MNVILECGVPVVLSVGAGILRFCLEISRPSPRALGSIIPTLCAVSADEIGSYCGGGQAHNIAPSHLHREICWKQLRVMRGYVRQMAWNTRSFQQTMRFEKMKIDPSKSSLEYEPRETLIVRLVDESAAVRRLLVSAQVVLLARALMGSKLSQQALGRMMHLVREYKQLEQDVVALVGMVQDDCYHSMLIERLGLNSWGLIDGASSTSA